jgi:hypothetical protein
VSGRLDGIEGAIRRRHHGQLGLSRSVFEDETESGIAEDPQSEENLVQAANDLEAHLTELVRIREVSASLLCE